MTYAKLALVEGEIEAYMRLIEITLPRSIHLRTMAMAAFDTTRPASGLSAGAITTFFMSAFSAVSAWNDARITRKSLSQLSARELDDIGLSYGDIEKIAVRAVR